MGNCFSAAVQQVVTELQQDNNNENNNNNNNNNSQQQQSTWAQAAGSSGAGGGNHQQQQQQQQHTTSPVTATTSKVSPIYNQLPAGAEKIQVRNVYDGDTMTLRDERRVRLLGIDTPEIKEQQPFAQEAKNYTKQLIDAHGDAVYLSFEPNQEKQDHYGRLLGYIYVEQSPNQYVCINEGIVQAGYASVYTPNAASKIQKFDKYISLQTEARTQKRGQWKSFQEIIVFKTTNGSAYHQKSCQHTAQSYNLQEIKASEALSMGLHPCRTCCT